MAKTPEPRRFNQTSRITARLRDLVRSYPKGLGLVKEFLQNADDASASYLHVTYDRRQHPGHLDKPEQEVVLGPALLFTNDSVFTPRDLENIQHIDDGGKLHEARSTGRFGQGFNSSYSVSDHPTLLTDDWVVWFDPHGRAHGRDRNAWAWSLTEATEAWPDWVETFRPAGVLPGAMRFNGTVFRLPLRRKEDAGHSEIMPEAFTEGDFEDILEEVQKAGPTLLIFLRSVQSLRVDEIAPDGTRRIRYELLTANATDVDAARRPLREAVRGDPKELLEQWLASAKSLPVASFIHAFHVFDDGKRTDCSWGVVTGLFRGPDNDLLRSAQGICAHGEKALPWAGAGASLDAGKKTGGLACFLPLPEPTRWPVMLHGWFDVDSARRGITRQAGTGEISRLRTQWNQALLRHGVGPVWGALVAMLTRDDGAMADPYRLWPRPSECRDEHDSALVEGFYSEIGALRVFPCVGPDGVVWRSLDGMGERFWTLNDVWHHALRAPLLANENTLVEPPLPAFAVDALKGRARVLSSEHVRNALQRLNTSGDIHCELSAAPHPALRRPEWVAALARFCAQDGLDKLTELPLALLADGMLHTFSRCGPLYLVTDAERSLLKGITHRLLDPTFQAGVELTSPVPALSLRQTGLAGMVEILRESLTTLFSDEVWWIRLFEHLEQLPLSEVRENKKALQTLALVPDQAGRLHPIGSIETPLLMDEIPHSLRQALFQLGVPIVSGSEELIASIQRFADRHKGFVWSVTPGTIIDQLAEHARTPRLHQDAFFDRAVLDPLLDFLSSPGWLRENDARADALRGLPILPTSDGAIVSAAETQDLYVPGGFEPPHGLDVRHRLLTPGPQGRWLSLFKALRVPEQDGHSFVVRGLLPAFRGASNQARMDMLRWLRDHLRAIGETLVSEKRSSLVAELINAELLPLSGAGFGAPAYMYRPDVEEVRRVLGNVAKIPDMERLGDDPKSWNGLFADLRLHSIPRESHLLDALQLCVEEADVNGVEAVRERLDTLRGYIARHWDSLSEPKKSGSQRFVDSLAGMAWLPASRPSREEVAAAVLWQDRLYKASELAAPKLLHLVASVFPVLDGEALPYEMAKALGLRTQVPFAEMVRHFEMVKAINQSAAGEKVRTACRTAFVEFVLRVAELSDTEVAAGAGVLASLRAAACIWLRGGWWRPRRVFLESLPFASDWCVSILEDQELARLPLITKGLTRLGVRARPESLDWVEMLGELRERIGERALSDDEVARVQAALQQLRVQDREWLQSQPISIPTIERRLMLARETLLPDDPRVKRMTPLCHLPLVEEVEVSLDIAEKAGSCSLRSALVDELAEEPIPSTDAELIVWGTQLTQRVRSSEFHAALRRLAWHEATERGGDSRAAANDERLMLARRLTLRIARDLRVKCRLHGTGESVFEQQASSFWDHDAALLWLRKAGKRKMGDELARTLATECGLEALRVSRLLEEEPSQMAGMLDEDGIAVIPVGAPSAAIPAWLAPDPLIDFQEATDTLRGEEYLEDEVLKVAEASASEGFDNARSLPRRPNSGMGGGRAGPQSYLGTWGGDAPPRADTFSTDGVPDAPTRPGFGSSHPWSPNASRPAQGRSHRLRSYVHRDEQNDYDTRSFDSERVQLIERLAMQRVIEWERAQGRTAAEVVDNLQGYDLHSSGERDSRFIEVKGIDGPWTARGVEVTRSEFRKAVEAGEAWWLYVVEHVGDPAQTRVHVLSNPFLKAIEYRFDHGWHMAAAAHESQPEGPMDGEKVVLSGGAEATVLEVEAHGQLWKVTLVFPDGHEEVRPWDPAWRQG
ncbi:DUF3883 domain-containing protein [Myxococcus xanthus]|uniref:DUF3883 domain-containing protein n=1 Tax=Myxococcus xanthus TaxID=34 RepID=A0A7Y4IK47_MYXXA|nr:DUF3883 domain-containing protein [Myxococcus xanthus]NOJ80768.1 DUF3883 domain-containing protein [Myxococcus xanthus]NOJ84520.1 DUF3883 domain-containing protein [Myxococcus xanthus]